MSTICTKHGLVHMTQRGCNRCNPLPRLVYANIILISETQMRKSPLGEPMPGIGEVISEHLVAERSTIDQHRASLERQHKAIALVVS